MGYNTVVLVLNDALGSIERDPAFNRKLSDAIMMWQRGKLVDIDAGSHIAAATVIESHHADYYQAVLVGGNCGVSLPGQVHYSVKDVDLEYCRSLANALGYDLHKKPGAK